MRLTLRNLLLYLDHQMAPADAEEFAEKIKQSEFATGLIERIRSVTRVRRMPAPKVDDKGLGGDANFIADYIENLLPQDRVKEFDKLCLDSDMLLAEVASCHHILTLVLAQPVQPSDELRDRIYAVPQLAATAHAREEAHAAAPPTPPVVAPPLPEHDPANEAAASLKSEQPAVPDYLRAGRSSGFWPIAGTIAATFLIVALVLRAMGPFDQRHPLARWLGGEPPVEVANSNSTPSPAPSTKTLVVAPMPTEGSEPSEDSAATTTTTEENTTAAASKIPPVETGDEPPAPEKPKPETEVTAKPALPTEVGEPKKPGLPDKPTAASADTPEPAKPVEPPASALEVGRFISDEQLLGRYDANMGVWMRVPPRALLVADEPLLSFPAFRPQIALGSGVQATFVGEGAFRVLAPAADGAPQMFVDSGRLLIVADGKPGSKVRLNLAGLEGVLSFTTPGAEVAIEVRYYLPPGANPEAAHGPRVIEIFAVSGTAEWREPEVEAVTIAANHAFTFVEKSLAEVRGPFKAPDWIDVRPTVATIDRDTRLLLDRALGYERSLNLALDERAEDRKVEVRSLAARCLVGMKKYGPALANLRDARLASFWTYDAEALRNALAHGPDQAAVLHKQVIGSREMDAALLYRLLVGYSPEQLAADGAAELVDALEHPELDVRVLAFDNLWRITGAMFNYRPERKNENNRTAVLRFRERLKDGTIAYKTPPSPLPDRKPLGK